MDDDTILQQSVHSILAQVVDAYTNCTENSRIFPVLVLIYSTMDMMGWLIHPDGGKPAPGQDFKAWAEEYMKPGASLGCSAEDLWGARCGILHTGSAESDHSRKGKAAPIAYALGGGTVLYGVDSTKEADIETKVVDMNELGRAFLEGGVRFIERCGADLKLKALVARRGRKQFSHYFPQEGK